MRREVCGNGFHQAIAEGSALSRSNCGVQPLQLDAGSRGGELLICFGVVLVAVAFLGSNFLGQGLLVGDTPIEALARQNAEF